jgi:hypothetical protein
MTPVHTHDAPPTHEMCIPFHPEPHPLPISETIRRPLFLSLDLAVASLERSTSHRLPQRRALPVPLPRRTITISIASHAACLPVHHGVAPVNRSRNHLPPTSRHLPPTSRQLFEAGRWQQLALPMCVCGPGKCEHRMTESENIF